jgi:hypothetical protein
MPNAIAISIRNRPFNRFRLFTVGVLRAPMLGLSGVIKCDHRCCDAQRDVVRTNPKREDDSIAHVVRKLFHRLSFSLVVDESVL